MSKTVNGETTQFTWDGMDMIYEETDGVSYACIYGATGILYRKSSTGEVYTYTTNAHGDVVDIQSSNGEQRGYCYTAYGEITETEGNIADNPFLYCGEYTDVESGLIYLRNRYYDPSIGRFISEDPIRDGANWYVYAGNNPVMFTDSSGLDPDLDEYIKNNYAGKVTVTIAASRPVENSRVTVDLDTGDVGHTFVRIDYGDGRVIYRGFYPSNPLSTEEIITKADVAGTIINDANHDWNAAVTYEITSDQADKMVAFIEGYESSYNMVTNNCTTFGVQVLAAGGVKAPTSKHKWTLPDNARQMVIDNLPSDKWFKGATADALIGGLKGFSPADAVQDFKNAPNYVLKYGGQTHVGSNSTGKTR